MDGQTAVDDVEHLELASIVARMADAVHIKDCYALVRAVKQMEHYASIRLMPDSEEPHAGHPSPSPDAAGHLHLEKELQRIRAYLEQKGGIWSESAISHFIHYLRHWMTRRDARKGMTDGSDCQEAGLN